VKGWWVDRGFAQQLLDGAAHQQVDLQQPKKVFWQPRTLGCILWLRSASWLQNPLNIWFR
jgi:hypothetical protein